MDATLSDLVSAAVARAQGVQNTIAMDKRAGRRTNGKRGLQSELDVVRGMLVSYNLLNKVNTSGDGDEGAFQIRSAIHAARAAINSI